jgi:hypothetical protein
MTDPAPQWRFVDALTITFPADVAIPPAVSEAAEHEQTRRHGLEIARDELATARRELETAEDADRRGEALAAGEDRPAPKPARVKAAGRVDLAERAVEAQQQAHKGSIRALLDAIWRVREDWQAEASREREQTRVELLALIEHVGERIGHLQILDELASGLEQLADGGTNVSGLSFAVPEETLGLRRQRRETLIEAALQPPANQLGYRTPAEPAEILAALAQHLRPDVEQPAELVAHPADRPAEAGWRDSVAWMGAQTGR